MNKNLIPLQLISQFYGNLFFWEVKIIYIVRFNIYYYIWLDSAILISWHREKEKRVHQTRVKKKKSALIEVQYMN